MWSKEAQDPSFLPPAAGGTERVLLSLDTADPLFRKLQVCDLSPVLNCEDVTVNGASGDFDGPNVIPLQGELIMVFNVVTETDEDNANIFIATAQDGDPTQWNAAAISVLATPERTEDDPAISPDGRVIVFGASHPDNPVDTELWFSHRSDLNSPWGEPELVQGFFRTQQLESSPEFGLALIDGAYELLFVSDRDQQDTHKIYSSLCRLEPRPVP